MSEWKEYKLGEICSFVKDKISMRDVSTDVYISTENMLPDKGGITRASSIPMDGMVTRYYPETVLISNIRPYFKKIWFADKEGGCSNDVLCFKGNDVLINSKYLYYLLAQDIFFDYVMLGSKGSKMPRGDKDHIMKWKVSIPPVDEQKRIDRALSSLDDKIDLLHRENATLEALAETLFRHYFIETPNPEWKEMPVSYYGKVICGKTPSKKNEEYYGGEVPFIKIPDMHGKTYVFNSEDTLSEKGKALQKEKTLPANSIMVSCIATVGLVSMNAIESQTNQQINSVVPNNEQYRYYLYCWFKLMYDELNTMASGGTATLNLNTGDFSRIGITLPDDDAIKEFHLHVKPIFAKIRSNQQQMQTLTIQRDTLLPRLMSGEVKIEE